MGFASVLNSLISSRNIRSCEICDGIGVKKSWLSKVRSGAILPSDFSIIRRLETFLNLSEAECSLLCEAYRKTCFLHEIAEVDRAFELLISLRSATPPCVCVSDSPATFTKNGTLLLADQVKQVCSTVMRSSKCIYVFGIPEGVVQCADFCNLLLLSESGAHVKWLIGLDDQCSSVRGLNIAVKLFPLMTSRKLEIRCTKHGVYAMSPFPLLIAFDSGVLLMRSDEMTGLYLTGEAGEVYRSFLMNCFDEGSSYIQTTSDLAEFFENYSDFGLNASDEAYSICKSPWLVPAASTTAIHEIMIENTLFDSYMVLLRKAFFGVKTLHEFFWEQGISDILYNEDYFEYGENLTTSFPLETRHLILHDTLTAVQLNQAHDYGVFYTTFPESTDLLCIDFWTNGQVLVILNVGESHFFITMHDTNITQALIRWIEVMRKRGLLTSKGTAIQICKEMLDSSEL